MGDGRQVISRDWIRQSTIARTRSRFSRRRYGYGWWMRTLAGHPTYYAWGYGGQFILCRPRPRRRDRGDVVAESGCGTAQPPGASWTT